MENGVLTEAAVAAAAGTLLSLAFSFIPGLRQAYDALNDQLKALVMLALNIVVIVAAFGLSCWGPYSYFDCTAVGAWVAVELAALVAVALVANQAAFHSTRRMAAVAYNEA